MLFPLYPSCFECFQELLENFSETFLSRGQPITQQTYKDVTPLKNTNLLALNDDSISTKLVKHSAGNFLRRKISRKIVLTSLTNFENFSDRKLFQKTRGIRCG